MGERYSYCCIQSVVNGILHQGLERERKIARDREREREMCTYTRQYQKCEMTLFSHNANTRVDIEQSTDNVLDLSLCGTVQNRVQYK